MTETLCLVGGTFDRFHAGHCALLESACNHDSVEVWITTDAMAAEKDPRIQSKEIRTQSVVDWAGQRNLTVHTLEDEWGPAPVHKEATHLACTPETKENCEKINVMRIENGLPELEIVDVQHVLSEDGMPISSSRIREGSINRDGQLWIRESDLKQSVRMAKILDSTLKQPQGLLFEGPEDTPEVAITAAVEAIPTFCPCLIAVGDVTVDALLKAGWIPDLALIDGMTKREVWAGSEDLDRTSFVGHLSCENPAGELTPELLECADLALEFAFSEDGGPVLLEIEGEEDLAPIFLHLLAPLGTAIMYGQPGKGVVLRITDEDVKALSRELLDQFEGR